MHCYGRVLGGGGDSLRARPRAAPDRRGDQSKYFKDFHLGSKA